MPELSLNILDLVENSFTAGATSVIISINEQTLQDTLTIIITDNGRGMNSIVRKKLSDPFFSEKTGKEWGLGFPFLQQTADLCNGRLIVDSAPDSGTQIIFAVKLSHIDRPPIGSLAATITAIVAGHSDKDISLLLRKDSETYELHTETIRSEIEGVDLCSPKILDFIDKDILEGIKKLELIQ